MRPISGFMGPFGPKRRITPARPPVLTQDVTTNGSGKWQRQVQPGQPGLTPDGMIYRPGEGPVTGPAPDRSVFRPSNQTPQPNSPDEQQGALAPVPHVVPPGIVVNASHEPSQTGHQQVGSQTAHKGTTVLKTGSNPEREGKVAGRPVDFLLAIGSKSEEKQALRTLRKGKGVTSGRMRKVKKPLDCEVRFTTFEPDATAANCW